MTPRSRSGRPVAAAGSAAAPRVRRFDSRLGRYFLVGCFAAAVWFAVMIVGVEAFAVRKPIASTIGFLVAVLVNYALQRRITFASEARHLRAAPSFFAGACLMAVVNLALFSLLSGYINYVVAQVLTTMAVFLLNYEFNRRYTFRR
jgi:putative flippase GtrA